MSPAVRELFYLAVGLSGYQNVDVAIVLIVIVAILAIWLYGRHWLEKQLKRKYGPHKWTETAPRVAASVLTTIILIAPTIPSLLSTQPIKHESIQPEPLATVMEPPKPQLAPPSVPEKIEPVPQAIPRKASPPTLAVPRKQRTAPPADIKSDPPSVTDKPAKPLEVAPMEATSIQPKEKLADILVRKCPPTDPADPAMERFPVDFIREWLGVIKTVSGRPKKDLQTVMRVRPRLRDGISEDAHLAEAIFTLRCLESEDYIRIMETSDPLRGRIGVVVNNLKFEFVTEEKRNEFLETL